jgi:hypothetical protein
VKVHLIYNPNGLPELRVHKAGCPDIADELPAGSGWPVVTSHCEIEVASQRAAAEVFYCDLIRRGEMDADDAYLQTEFLPCTNGLLPERDGDSPGVTMTWSGPQVLLPLAKSGTVTVTFMEEGHAVAEANQGSTGVKGDVTYREEHWDVFTHLWTAHDWGEDPCNRFDFKAVRNYLDPRSARVMPPTWRAAVVAEITAAVRAYAAANPQTLLAGVINYTQHQLDRAVKELHEAEQAYREKAGEVNDLSDRLEELREKQGE